MKDLKLIPIEKLLAYAELFEKFGAICNEMVNFSNDAIQKRIAPKSKFDKIMDKVVAAAEKNDNLLVKLQEEIDRRVKAEFQTSQGIGFFTGLTQEFNDLMEEIQKENQKKPITMGPKLITSPGEV